MSPLLPRSRQKTGLTNMQGGSGRYTPNLDTGSARVAVSIVSAQDASAVRGTCRTATVRWDIECEKGN